MPRCALLIVLMLVCAPTLFGDDWPHWRGPAYNGVVADSPKLVESFGPGGPKKLWESEVFRPNAKDTGSGSVTVVDGRAYTYVNPRWVQPRPWKRMSTDLVFCFDAKTGKTLWKKELPSWHLGWSASCTPTVVDGKCYLLSSEAIVYCFDAKTGRQVWKSDFIGRQGNKHNRSSSPLVVDGAVVVVTPQNAVGLDAATGKVLWRNTRARTEYGSAVPWKSGGKTYAVMLAGRAYCFDPKTGDNAWNRVSGGNGATPTIVGDVMAAEDNSGVMLYKLDARNPKRLGRARFADQFTTPTIHDGHVYVFGGAYGNKKPSRAMCVDAASGRMRWDVEAGPFEFSSGTVADGKIILVGRDTLYLIKATPEKYTELAKARLRLRSWSSVAFVDGRIFLRAKDRVICYDLRK